MRETALSSVDGHYRWLPGSDGRQIRAGAPRPLGAAKSNEWVYLLTLEKAGKNAAEDPYGIRRGRERERTVPILYT